MQNIWILLPRGKSKCLYFANFNFIQLLVFFVWFHTMFAKITVKIFGQTHFSSSSSPVPISERKSEYSLGKKYIQETFTISSLASSSPGCY